MSIAVKQIFADVFLKNCYDPCLTEVFGILAFWVLKYTG